MRVRRTLAALLVAPFALAACGGGSSSVADPPVSSSPTSSAPTTEPPAHESPQHFIRRFYAAEKLMENTGSTGSYEEMVIGCRPCNGLVKQVRRFYAKGGFISWGGLTIDSIIVFSSDTKNRPSYTVKYTAQPTRYRESSSSSVKTLKGGPSSDVLTLFDTGNGWKVAGRARLGS